MQSPAEKYLVQKLVSFLSQKNQTNTYEHSILNAGAGQSVSIEQQLTQFGCRYVCDRIDIEPCKVDFPGAGESWQCSIDDMKPVKSGRYVAVFANYVLEHVANIEGAFQEIHRVLAPSGLFVTTLPNPLALECVLSKHTPLWFHKLVRGKHGWETEYAYASISDLLNMLIDSGFRVEEENRWPFVQNYLGKNPVIGKLGKLYEKAILNSNCRMLMGHVCLILQKPTC
jgi:SAM-dependent methyltransferase